MPNQSDLAIKNENRFDLDIDFQFDVLAKGFF